MWAVNNFVFLIAILLTNPSYAADSSCQDDKIKPNSMDCNSYLICLHGKEIVIQCPRGLKFNKEQNICDWPESSHCSVETKPVVVDSTNSTHTNGNSTLSETDNVQINNNVTPSISAQAPTLPPAPIPHGPSPRFAPYFDVVIEGPTLSQVAEKTGQLDYTLAFALGGYSGCVPKWGGEKDIDDPEIIGEIRKVQAKGGQMIVALGGAVGPYLSHLCQTVDSLAKAYTTILDVVKTNHLDVDVEAPINLDLLNKALAKVQIERPSTTVSYTLMVQAEEYGLNFDLGVKTLESAKANGVQVEIVNPMTMEFGASSADWGDAVIGAAKSTLKQMKTIWPEKSDAQLYRMLGVTPMLGRNFNGKLFQPQHARKLVDWANMNKIGLLAFWSIGRDNGGCANGPIKPSCSSVSQSEFEFTKIFQEFQS